MKKEAVKTLSDLVEFINERAGSDSINYSVVNKIILDNGWLDLCGEVSDVCTDGVDKVYFNDNGKADITNFVFPDLYYNLIGCGAYGIVDAPSNGFDFLDVVMFGDNESVFDLMKKGGTITPIKEADEEQQTALEVFQDNDVNLSEYTHILTIEEGDDTLYYLLWENI